MSATILILGANFNNKGAQSMLFTTISTIRQKYADTNIIFGHSNKNSVLNNNFKFDEIYYNNSDNYHTEQLLKKVDLIIDISGFALGKKWGINSARRYIHNIELAKKFNIPIVLMPQSFGTFDFDDHQTEIDELMKFMTYPTRIFAREHEGFKLLTEDYQLTNVKWHPDLVLCNQKINLNSIYNQIPEINVPKIETDSNVAVIPNLRSFDRGHPIQTLQIFYEVVKFLLSEGKNVYLMRHSFEDIVPCRWIKSLFVNDERVHLLENDFSCFEYDEMCKQFEFLVVGRFHGIVHAYKNNIPCILLGWAIKYRELAQLMYQNQYIFDITKEDFEIKQVLEAIHDMNLNLKQNKLILSNRLAQVQTMNTCFEDVFKLIEHI